MEPDSQMELTGENQTVAWVSKGIKMKDKLIFVSVFLSIAVMSTIFALVLPKHGEVVYNCSIAEISPDIPVEVKEQCRKLRMEQVK